MSIYQDIVLDHYRSPRNRGELPPPKKSARVSNPLCGDVLAMDVYVRDGVVQDVRFDGDGCAISVASASLLTEYAKGKSVSDVLAMTKEDIIALVGIEVSPSRLKCVLIALESLQKALQSD